MFSSSTSSIMGVAIFTAHATQINFIQNLSHARHTEMITKGTISILWS